MEGSYYEEDALSREDCINCSIVHHFRGKRQVLTPEFGGGQKYSVHCTWFREMTKERIGLVAGDRVVIPRDESPVELKECMVGVGEQYN